MKSREIDFSENLYVVSNRTRYINLPLEFLKYIEICQTPQKPSS